jgi:hypothetical protein
LHSAAEDPSRSEQEHIIDPSEDAGDSDLAEPDDVRGVLAALQRLAGRTPHPVVRACLEQAHDDIVHLTACGDEIQDDTETV